MTTTNIKMNDTLTEQDLETVTGVKPGTSGWVIKTAKVLDKAEIYYWYSHGDKKVITTWHHVHQAGGRFNTAENASALPNFDAIT